MILWKEIEIYDLIQLSKNSYTVNSGLMGGALYFWNETSHNFYIPYGMITPTLLDVAAITDLPPLGGKILTTTKSTTGVKYAIDISSTTYQSFILNNRGQDEAPVSDNEHIAFLLYWLSGVVFCTQSIQVEVTYLPLAIMLAEGRKLCLAKLFLTRLYLTLDWITDLMREKKRITNVDGPVWFFQLWLSSIFESELQQRLTQKGPTDSVIAGHRLLNLVFPDKLMASHDKMKHFFCAFITYQRKTTTSI
ncbi:hypothetical protein Ahy_B06g082286 [Arachis hypogaea]|uniref:Aminotransferase-like plant mobile domain-containing protein n=1 Tax=Arachis hypogaea TaxID=3818 RepID=A0A444YN67_ARAHY|nr:hypothetical protein Ahy_B06g082286 [Arachis hypogaea]